MKEIIAVGTAAGMKKEKCREIAEMIKKCVTEMLSEYLQKEV